MLDTARSTGLWFLNTHVSIAVPASSNEGGLSVLLMRMPHGEAPPLHVHHDEDEVFHVIAGEVRYRVGDRTVAARAGETLLAPRGTPHGFRVLSRDGAHVLTIAGQGFETLVRALARPAAVDALPEPVVPTLERQSELAAACQAQKIDILGPPID